MSEKFPTSTPEELNGPEQSEAFEAAAHEVASAFHEDWRKTRLQEDGSFEPRMKSTSDVEWIAKTGTNEVDIANTEYDDLPADWQEENKEAAMVVVGVLEQFGDSEGKVDISNEDVRNQVGDVVHQAWLFRNKWAAGGDLDVPFADLPKDEQDKDISQIQIAQELLS